MSKLNELTAWTISLFNFKLKIDGELYLEPVKGGQRMECSYRGPCFTRSRYAFIWVLDKGEVCLGSNAKDTVYQTFK